MHIVTHPSAKRFRYGGGETVVHLMWQRTGGSDEPRGSEKGRAAHPAWVWEKNITGMLLNWHCFQITDGAPGWRSDFT